MWKEYLISSWKPETIKYHSNNLNPLRKVQGSRRALNVNIYSHYNTGDLCQQNADAVSQMWHQIHFGDGQTQMSAWHFQYHHCLILKCFKWCKKEDFIIYNKDIHIVMNYLSWLDKFQWYLLRPKEIKLFVCRHNISKSWGNFI